MDVGDSQFTHYIYTQIQQIIHFFSLTNTITNTNFHVHKHGKGKIEFDDICAIDDN